jgi:hypothetical protein
MTALRLPALRLNHMLGAATIMLLGIAAWPWLVPPVPATRPLTVPTASGPAPTLASLPPPGNYAAIVDRPLFSPSRRAAPGAAGAVGASIESRYRLLGVVATGPKKKAFIAEGARRAEISEGETLDGWTVKTIGQDRVSLTSPAGEAALVMKPVPPEPLPKPQ